MTRTAMTMTQALRLAGALTDDARLLNSALLILLRHRFRDTATSHLVRLENERLANQWFGR